MSPHRMKGTEDEEFYAKALTIMTGPQGRFMLWFMRAANLIYWFFVVGALGWLFSQVIDRNAPIELRRFEVKTPFVAAGGELKISYEIDRNRSCQAETYWTIYDGNNEIRRYGPSSTMIAGPVGMDTYVRAWAIPQNVAPGPARLRVTLAWQCPGNYLHAVYPITLVLPDAYFEITRRGD